MLDLTSFYNEIRIWVLFQIQRFEQIESSQGNFQAIIFIIAET